MKNIIGLVLFTLFILTSCKKDDNILSETGNIKYSSQLQSANPYEWVGIRHNDYLTYVMNNIDTTATSGIWNDIDNNLNDSLVYYIDEYAVISNDTLASSQYKNYLDDWGSFENPDSLVNKYRNLLTSSTAITSRDSIYSTKVLDLAVDIMNNNYSTSVMWNKIDSLEDSILNISWNSSEIQTLMSISLFKNAISYHLLNNPSPFISGNYGKNNHIQYMSRTEVGVCGVVDFVAGAGTFLAETGASGGVAAPIALVTSVEVASKASGYTEIIGRFFDWW